jgi:hypothetical protein
VNSGVQNAHDATLEDVDLANDRRQLRLVKMGPVRPLLSDRQTCFRLLVGQAAADESGDPGARPKLSQSDLQAKLRRTAQTLDEPFDSGSGAESLAGLF